MGALTLQGRLTWLPVDAACLWPPVAPVCMSWLQVFVEYVTNDGYHHGSVDNSLVRSFERLLRKLLAFKHAPAVVLMEFLATDVKTSSLPFYATGGKPGLKFLVLLVLSKAPLANKHYLCTRDESKCTSFQPALWGRVQGFFNNNVCFMSKLCLQALRSK